MTTLSPTSQTSRRKFLRDTAVLGVTSSAGLFNWNSSAQEAPAKIPATEISALDAVELSRAIQSRSVSCVEVMQACLDQIDAFNPAYNALVSLVSHEGLLEQAKDRDEELARGQSRGWMHGFPHAVKDLSATRGIPTTFGSPLFRDFVPDHDAIFVERLRQAGAILIGKSNTPELGLGSQSYNPVFGATRNAYDETRTAGGSSGGAAVALALRMVPVADGSDMMGSLRNPTAFNNVIGFRPSYGRVPNGPRTELYLQQLGYGGPMGRTVKDTAMLLSTMAGFDDRDPLSLSQDPGIFAGSLSRDFNGSKVGWLGDYDGYLPMEEGVLNLCRASLRHFENLGCHVEDVSVDYSMDKLWQTWLTHRHGLLATGGLKDFYDDPTKRAMMKPEVQWEIEGGLDLGLAEFQQASKARSDWYQVVRRLFDEYDFLVLPSAQVFPFDVETHWPREIAGRQMDTYHRWMEVVIGGTLSGCPVINLPAGFSPAGLPMGIQVMGPMLEDFTVLQVGHAYEQQARWNLDIKPPVLSG